MREYDKEGKLIRETVTEIKETEPDNITLSGNEWWKPTITYTDKTSHSPLLDTVTVTCRNDT